LQLNNSSKPQQPGGAAKFNREIPAKYKAQQTIRKIRLRNNKFSISATAIRRSSRGAPKPQQIISPSGLRG
jgi:hypothetical protein